MRVLNYALVVVGLAGSHQCISTFAGGEEALVQPSRQGGSEVPVDAALARRWAELFAGIIAQFQADGRDLPGNLEGDFTTREIRVRASTAGDNDSLWVSKTLTESELRTADLGKTVRELYEAAKRKAGER